MPATQQPRQWPGASNVYDHPPARLQVQLLEFNITAVMPAQLLQVVVAQGIQQRQGQCNEQARVPVSGRTPAGSSHLAAPVECKLQAADVIVAEKERPAQATGNLSDPGRLPGMPQAGTALPAAL